VSPRPLVFAHRGASAVEPEHTLAAYLRALEDGADGLECDVRLTRDGHLVCLHDRRLERTSNGRGRVSRSTLAELSQLDFGSWHMAEQASTESAAEQAAADSAGSAAEQAAADSAGSAAEQAVADSADSVDGVDGAAEQADPDEAAELTELDRRTLADADSDRLHRRGRLLTLDRLLTAVCAAGRPVRLLVETKHPSRYGADVERRLLTMLDRHGLATPGPGDPVRVVVMSFSPLAIRRIHELAPGLPTALLLEILPPAVRLGRLPFGARIAGPSIGLLRRRPALAAALRAAGNEVYVWTVNEPADVELARRLGVDGIITDRPRFVLDRVGG
jgi:glycerophosphoryl diester phosphodiesterase